MWIFAVFVAWGSTSRTCEQKHKQSSKWSHTQRKVQKWCSLPLELCTSSSIRRPEGAQGSKTSCFSTCAKMRVVFGLKCRVLPEQGVVFAPLDRTWYTFRSKRFMALEDPMCSLRFPRRATAQRNGKSSGALAGRPLAHIRVEHVEFWARSCSGQARHHPGAQWR